MWVRRPLPVLLAPLALALVAAPPAVTASGGPASARSRAVVQRVAPTLRAELEARGLRLGAPVFLRVFKEERELEVWLGHPDGRHRLLETHPICAVSGELGPKLAEGDGQAPEGFYAVRAGQLNPRSRFHLALNLGFPNAYDRAHDRTGSFLMIHGACASRGCYAMTDPTIERVWVLVDAALRAGQRAVPVHAFPFRMSDARLEAAEGQRWHRFWAEELRPVFDAFERTRVPPRVRVRGDRYVLASR